jgi:hypothetical protein
MRWAQVWKFWEKIAVGRYAVRCYFPVCEDGEEVIEGVVSKCAPILGIRCRACVVKAQDVRQQGICDPLCFLWCIPAGVLQ